MNSEQPEFKPSPREELEARITALLLGELPETEAAALREKIAADAELVKLHARLGLTIGLVKEAIASPEPAELAAPEGLKLSEEKREKLLASFKTVAPEQFEKKPVKVDFRTIAALAAMIVFLLALSGMFLPSLAKSKSKWRVAIREEDSVASASSDESVEKLQLHLLSPAGTRILPGPPSAGNKISISGQVDPAQTATLMRRAGQEPLVQPAMTPPPEPPGASAPLAGEDRGGRPVAGKPAAQTPTIVAGGATRAPRDGEIQNNRSFSGATALTDEKSKGPADSLQIALPTLETEKAAEVAQGEGKDLFFAASTTDLSARGFEVNGVAGNTWGLNAPANESSTFSVNGLGDVNLTPRAAPSSSEENNRFIGRYAYQFGGFGGGGGGIGGATAPAGGDKAALAAAEGKLDLNALISESTDREGKKDLKLAEVESVGAVEKPAMLATSSAVTPGLRLLEEGRAGESELRRSLATSEVIASDDVKLTQLFDSAPNSNLALGQQTAETRELDRASRDGTFAGQRADRPAIDNLGELKQTEIVPLTGLARVENEAVRQKIPESLSGRNAGRELSVQLGHKFASAEPQKEAAEITGGRGDALAKKMEAANGPAPTAPGQKVFVANVEDADPQEVGEVLRSTMGRDGDNRAGGRPARPLAANGTTALRDGSLGVAAGSTLAPEKQSGAQQSGTETSGNVRPKPAQFTSRVQEFNKGRIAASTKVQDARLLIENGRLDEAEKYLKEALKEDPDHRAANYYLNFLAEQKVKQEERKREEAVKDARDNIDKSWKVPVSREKLPESAPKASPVAPIPQPEVAVSENAFSTFSLNVSDVSFKLAAASLEKGVLPDAAGIRSEEFINAFDYRDPAAVGSAPVAFAWERARYPFAQDRDLLRFSVKTGASGREAGRPLNLVLLLDNSGSMERADRVRIIQECLRVLAAQLQPQDVVSVVTFARTARLRVDGLAGSAAGDLPARVGEFTPEGGTNLEEAMRVAYETAAKHFQANGVNRVVLLTDGAANLGDVRPEALKKSVEEHRKQGVALDCFGIGWEGLNDDLLEQLSRNGDGRYGFVNSPEEASANFATQLAGALHVAASDVKVQVEFNPKRTTIFRQIGYAKHQLTKEQFRDNTVDAAELGAAEAGNALYVVQTNPGGEGPIATVRVRFKVPGTNDYREQEWPVPYEGAAKLLEASSAPLRLAATAAEFSEWLAANPYAAEVTPDRLLTLIANVPEAFPNDPRPKQLEWMIRQAKSIAGK